MYYGLSLNVGNFGLDIYLTQFIFGVVELPARLGSLPLLQRLGRKIIQASVLIFGGLACLALIAIPKGTLLKYCTGVFKRLHFCRVSYKHELTQDAISQKQTRNKGDKS